GILITTIASKGELQNWPELLPKLCSLLDSEDYNTCEGAFGALQKICEDSAEILDSDVLDRPLNIMIPKFLQFFKHSSPKIRQQSAPATKKANGIPGLSTASWFKGGDPSLHLPDSGKGPYQEWPRDLGLTNICKYFKRGRKKKVQALSSGASDRTRGSSHKQKLRMEQRCEHYTHHVFPMIFQCHVCLRQLICWLIPVLVNGMKYSEIDIILLKGDVEEDEAIPDSEQDIRPRFHRSKTVAQQHEEDGIEDDDDDDDELDDDDTISDWNL
ncbi:TNPO1 protein, partial [Ploceus nigricollis]|nr:TNPO1 protein [Ploceus nigricollis]